MVRGFTSATMRFAAATLLGAPAAAMAQVAAGGTPQPPQPGVYVQADAAPLPPPRPPAPQGWMGIHYICDIETWTKNRETFVRHRGYPLIASVEPGSPADRAGIQAGDTILAYDNDDVNGRTISLTKLLRPGNRVSVKVRRARETFDIPVTVGKRSFYAPDVAVIASTVPFTRDSLLRERRVEVVGDRVVTTRVRTPVAPEPATTVGPVIVATPPTAAMTMFFRTTAALAGAELARVTDQLGEVFGVSRGVLVLQVAPNTPASRAGLRGGDVIVRVNDLEVVAPIQMQRALERASDEQNVKLTVVRKKKEIVVPLKW